MRPTRWTRRKRVTYPGKGGWHFQRQPQGDWWVQYTHPVTGHGYSGIANRSVIVATWRTWRLRARKERERERERRERRMRPWPD